MNKIVRILLVYLFVLLCVIPDLYSSYRTWTDVSGRKIDAQLLYSNDEDSISIILRNGKRSRIFLKTLSLEDVNFVNEHNKQVYSGGGPMGSPYFEIQNVRQVQLRGYTDTFEGQEYNIQGIAVQVRYNGSHAAVAGYVKIYFYDDKGVMIPHREKGPYLRFEKGRRYNFEFPVSRIIAQRNWKTALVVFGDETQASARIIPSSQRIAFFDFEEKNLVFPGWNKVLDSYFGNSVFQSDTDLIPIN